MHVKNCIALTCIYCISKRYTDSTLYKEFFPQNNAQIIKLK